MLDDRNKETCLNDFCECDKAFTVDLYDEIVKVGCSALEINPECSKLGFTTTGKTNIFQATEVIQVLIIGAFIYIYIYIAMYYLGKCIFTIVAILY